MPLLPGRSKKAFSKNVETEMAHGKPQPQALAIAYSVKRKHPKKMADGGEVNAKKQRRPMPDNRYNDSHEVSRNSGDKPAHMDSWTDRPDIPQSQRGPKTTPIKHPKMVPQNTYSTRLRSEEDELQRSAGTNEGPQQQPPAHDDEEGADRQGPSTPSLKMKKMAEGGRIDKGGRVYPVEGVGRMFEKGVHQKSHEETRYIPTEGGERAQYPEERLREHKIVLSQAKNIKPKLKGLAEGGMLEPDHGIELHERDEEAHLMSNASPSEDEGERDADSRDEEGQDRQGPDVSDMEDEHSTGRKPYAGGGKIGDSEENEDHAMELNPAHDKHSPDDSEDQPYSEEEIEHAASIAAAIMAKRRQMARGGEILSEDSMESTDDDQADLSRNAEEDANMEDKASFDALRKENYSESDGLDALDQPHDSNLTGDSEEEDSENDRDRSIVSAIRKKMKSRSPMTR